MEPGHPPNQLGQRFTHGAIHRLRSVDTAGTNQNPGACGFGLPGLADGDNNVSLWVQPSENTAIHRRRTAAPKRLKLQRHLAKASTAERQAIQAKLAKTYSFVAAQPPSK